MTNAPDDQCMPLRPDFSGTWKADLAASKLVGLTPKEIVASLVHADPDLRVDMTIISADGTPARMRFGVRATNEPVANTVFGGEWVSRSRWVADELLIESRVNQSGRQMHFCDYWSVSSDGRRLTMEHRDDDLAGQVTVLERV